MPAGFVTVCLYTATQLSSCADETHDDGQSLHAEVTVEGTQWRSSSRQMPVDWEQEQHVFVVTDAAHHVTITLRTAAGDAIATANHPLDHAYAWGAERCRLSLVHPATNAPAGSLHVGVEYTTTQDEDTARAVSASNSGKAVEKEEQIMAYLDAHITPVLKAALVDVVQQKPENPLKFIGQRLLDAK